MPTSIILKVLKSREDAHFYYTYSTPLASKVHCSINGLENSSSLEYSKVQHLFEITVGLFSVGVGLFSRYSRTWKKSSLNQKKSYSNGKSPTLTFKSPPLTKKVLLQWKSPTLTFKSPTLLIFFVCFHAGFTELWNLLKTRSSLVWKVPNKPTHCCMQSSHSTWKFCSVLLPKLSLWQEAETCGQCRLEAGRPTHGQGDLATAPVQHLHHFQFLWDWVDGEADDGEGHDGQHDTRIRLLKAIHVQTCMHLRLQGKLC